MFGRTMFRRRLFLSAVMKITRNWQSLKKNWIDMKEFYSIKSRFCNWPIFYSMKVHKNEKLFWIQTSPLYSLNDFSNYQKRSIRAIPRVSEL